MKNLIVAAVLVIGTAAAAQQPSGETVSDPSQSTGPRGVTQQGTNPQGQACSPPGFNMGASAYPPCGSTAAPPVSPADLPACSRTVTDNCIQAYERGVRRR